MGAAGRNPMTGSGLGSTARAVARSAVRSVAFLSPGSRPGRPVVALYDGAAGAEQVLALAARLACEDDRNLVVLVPQDAPRRQRKRNGRSRITSRARACAPRLRRLPDGDAASLAREVRAVGGRLLVLRGGHRLCDVASLATLLSRAGCPWSSRVSNGCP